jgi:tRNA dimethylallyltransferase
LNSTTQKYLIIIAGPTAVGKTKVAIELAKYFDTEIISADSRQIYQELNIGVARPSVAEFEQAKHHFIANKSIKEYVSAGNFEKEVLDILENLYQTKNVAILCGGTGFYINAVLNGFDEIPEIDQAVRQQLNEDFKENGIVFLQELLKNLDIETYEKMDINNTQRVIRALEVCLGTGKKFSSFKDKKQNKRNFIPIKIGLNLPKEILHHNINKRVDEMMENGFLEEAKKLIPFKNFNALQTVGYKELFDYFEEKTSLQEAIDLIKLHTRQYAKRQMTFFNRHQDYTWFEPQQTDGIIQYIKNII